MFHRKRHQHHNQQLQQQQQQQPKPQMPSQQHLRSSSVGSRSTSDSNASLIVLDDSVGDSTSLQVGQLATMDDDIGVGSAVVANPRSSSNSLKLMTIEGFRRRSTSPVCPKAVHMAATEPFGLSSDHSPVRKPKSSPASPARVANHSSLTSPDTHSSSSSSSLTGLFRRKARSPFELSSSQSFSLPPPRPHRNHHVSSTNHSTQNSGYHPSAVLEPKGRSLSPLPTSPSVDENHFTRGRKISNNQQPPPLVVLNVDQLDSCSWQPQPSLLSLIDSRQISLILFVNNICRKNGKRERWIKESNAH